MPSLKRHFLKTTTGLLAGLLLAGVASAQSFPTKPVTLMIPYPAGGLSDNIARRVNVPLGAALGQPAIVDNLGGGSGSIGAQKVLNAPSDGYMVFQGSPNELILAPLAISAIKYKPESFRQIHRIALAPMAIFVRPGFPAKTADELAAHAAKVAKEGKPMTYASVGVGSFYHLLGAKMSKDLGVEMTHVPYKGGADAQRDLFTDLVDIFITPYGPAQVELVKQGKMRALAVLTPARQRLMPEVPSTTESKALKTFTAEIGTGYFVKRDTPEPVVQALHQALQKTLGDTQLRAGLFAMGQETSPLQTLAEADQAYKAEISAYQAIAKSINLQAQ
ncbi:MAG: tripartite tricarboxylate transporter substrate binding protein [Comamonadaceae bacterium]|uniref:tripartite tricarboxylate transporter substrate binding protein n=1 Tax=Candidatus Skiveiella danica TaxID=3386177 RepID=UPI003909E2E6|nr:tripartite tricarboxylate transporter substrate binding protein [Comamonadaceae bacterium]